MKYKKLALGGMVDDTKLTMALGEAYGRKFNTLDEALAYHKQNEGLYQQANSGTLNPEQAKIARQYQQASLVLSRNPEADKYVSKTARNARGTYTGNTFTGGSGEAKIDQFQNPNLFKEIDTEQVTLATDKKPTILPKGKTTVLNTPSDINYLSATEDLNSPAGFSSKFSSKNISVDPNVANLSNVKDYTESMIQSKYLQNMNHIAQQAMRKGDKNTLAKIAQELNKGGYQDYANKLLAGKPMMQQGGLLATDIKDTGRRKKDYMRMTPEQLNKELELYANYDFETQPIEPQSLSELKQVIAEMNKSKQQKKPILPKKSNGGKIQNYQDGGMVEGLPHEQGGVPTLNQEGEQIAEVEGGERIDSVEDTQTQDQLVQAIMNSTDPEEQEQLATELGWYVVNMVMEQTQNQQQEQMPMAKKGMKLLNKF